MLAFFYSLGKHSFSKQFLKVIDKGFAIEESHNFIIRIDVSSYQSVLFGSNDLIIICTKYKSRQRLFCCIELLLRRTLLTKIVGFQLAMEVLKEFWFH